MSRPKTIVSLLDIVAIFRCLWPLSASFVVRVVLTDILTNFDVCFFQTSVLLTVLLRLVWELLPWVSCILVWS